MSVDTAWREAGRCDRYIGACGDLIDCFVPCVGRRYQIRPVRLFRTFCLIFGHFRTVCGHCPAMSAIARSPAPFRLACRYSVPLSRVVCLKENRPAHRLGWTGRSRRERWSAVPNSHRASGGRFLEEDVLKQKRCR